MLRFFCFVLQTDQGIGEGSGELLSKACAAARQHSLLAGAGPERAPASRLSCCMPRRSCSPEGHRGALPPGARVAGSSRRYAMFSREIKVCRRFALKRRRRNYFINVQSMPAYSKSRKSGSRIFSLMPAQRVGNIIFTPGSWVATRQVGAHVW